MRKMILALSAATLAVPAVALPDSAMARGVGSYHGQSWRGNDGRTYCRKPSGTTGLVLGGAAGALLGREVDKHGERTTGTVLGAAVGALLGRQVQRNVVSRCR
jgi:hypothetical protein